MNGFHQLASNACRLAAFCTALLTIAPLQAVGEERSAMVAAKEDTLERLRESLEEEFLPVSYLDPTIQQPQQSIEQFAAADGDAVEPLHYGPLKHAWFTATWFKSNDLGFTDLELTSQWGWFEVQKVPLLTLSPGLAVHVVDGPGAPDLPGQLYDLSLDVKGLIPFSQTFALELGLTPGLFSDFEDGTEDAFRCGARAVGYYTWSHTLRLAFGASYLDRFDVTAIPVGGVIWTPDEDIQLQLTFPRAKFARRTRVWCGNEDWWYLAADFNGGSWAIQRASGAADTIGYRDLRLSLGWERRMPSGPTAGLEFGCVFNRRLEYKSGEIFDPGETIMLRGSVGF
jgi:hypothetical protein